MDVEEARSWLRRFRIPDGDMPSAESVRGSLARMLADSEVALGELQTARDIARLSQVSDAYAYVFLAKMFASLRQGNTAFNPCMAVAGEDGAELEEWERAVRAAGALSGEVVNRDGNGLWYFTRHKVAVDSVARQARARLKKCDETLSGDEVARFSEYRRGDGGTFSLFADQADAVKAAVGYRLSVVTGGPGTGKTTIVCSMLRALFAKTGICAADVALVAPTGRAAQRMGEALGNQCAVAVYAGEDDKAACDAIASLEGRTVHSLLGGRGPNWTYNARNPLPHRVVIVDECSMVDLLLMDSLLSALRQDCRLVLLGDKNQLPSVEAGAVLGDLMTIGAESGASSFAGAFVELTESRRFKGRLKECAEQINSGETSAVMSKAARLPLTTGESWTAALSRRETEDGCFWLEPGSEGIAGDVDELVREWAAAHGLGARGRLAAAADAVGGGDIDGTMTPEVRELFNALDASRILTVVRDGPLGARHVNDLLARERLGRSYGNSLAAGGMPVIITRNTPALGLMNGDVGVTVKCGNVVAALFRRGERLVRCPVSQLPEHDVSYAMTVHKSQGSEFDDVLVMLPDDAAHPLLNRQLLYTGVTRAKKRAAILGGAPVLKAAISRRLERITGLALASGA